METKNRAELGRTSLYIHYFLSLIKLSSLLEFHSDNDNVSWQDARPPFDIHEYGDRVLDKLSMEGAEGKAMSFEDVVRGQEKHDVARTFSALLQLVIPH